MQTRGAAQLRDLDALSDAELVELPRRNDDDAFRTIMQRNNRRLYRVARSIMDNDSEAGDVVQQAYVSAFSSLANFRGESSLTTWLTRIALNEALGRLRRQRPMVDLAALDGEGPAKAQAI